MIASTAGGTGTGPGVSRKGLSVTGGRLGEQRLNDLGLRAAACRLHDLTDEEADQGLLAGAELLGLPGVRGDDLCHDRRERAGVRDLTQAARLDDRRRVAGPLASDEGREHLLRTRGSERAVAHEAD